MSQQNCHLNGTSTLGGVYYCQHWNVTGCIVWYSILEVCHLMLIMGWYAVHSSNVVHKVCHYIHTIVWDGEDLNCLLNSTSTGVRSSSRTENHASGTVCKTLWTHVEQHKMCLWSTNTISWMKVAVVVVHLRQNTTDKTKSSKGFWQIREQGRQDQSLTLAHRG